MKNSWDKILLISLSALVIGLAGWFIFQALQFGDRFVMAATAPNNQLPETDAESVKFAAGIVQNTQMYWVLPQKGAGPKSLPLFRSILLVEKEGRLYDMSDPNEQPILPPFTNKWLIENKLNFLDNSTVSLDSDNDGYTNLEEWVGQTSPIDPQSHPPYTDKLSFRERTSEDYKVLFAVRPDPTRYQIRRLPTEKWPQGKSWFLSLGEVTEDGQLRLDSFEEKQAQSQLGIMVDASVLSVTFMPKGSKHELIRNIAETFPTFFVTFDFALGGGEIKVKEGESFVLPPQPEVKYVLLKANQDSATISFKTPAGEEKTVEIIKKK